jgi:hypothetical protein
VVGQRRPILRPSSIGGIVARLIGRGPPASRRRDPDPATMGRRQRTTPMTEPIDETQPHPSSAGVDLAVDGSSEPGAAAPADGGAAAASDPVRPLQADPNRPADSGWREPAWFPPRDRRDRRPSAFALVVGLALIAVGLYYFLDRTLGLDMPAIQWSSLWPIILIVIGGLILLRSFERKA